ncbi:hypothetical protein [Bordetella flabilis]|nr:hypothetical protein [Bordetella flabilis]
MKTPFCILLALALLGQAAAHGADISRTQNRKDFGHFVQERMTAAFDRELSTTFPCGDRPAYYCGGLMVTAFEQDSLYWTEPNITKLSFTYFRTDIATELFGAAGLALWPKAYVDNIFPPYPPGHPPYTAFYRCAFPIDGLTVQRDDAGCGERYVDDQPVPNTAPCGTIGITTAQQWLAKYHGTQTNFCGFALIPGQSTAKQNMDTVIEIARVLQQKQSELLLPWNEVVAGPWRGYDAGRIPVMAFFSVADNSVTALVRNPKQTVPGKNLNDAQTQQKWYFDLTKIFVPIVEISAANEGAVFTYRDEDQAAGIPDVVTVFPR